MTDGVFSQEVGTVAFQGALGANSHKACKETVPNMDLLPCVDFDRAFESLISGEADLAVIPIENSSAGRVADIHRLLPDSGLHIVGEHFLPIPHCLVAPKGVKIADIRQVYSHEQALSQCRGYLNERGLEATKFGDTAAAAQWVARQGAGDRAAICPALAAEIYDLNILDHNINDRPGNTTRFLILARSPRTPPLGAMTITSLLFRTKSEPASLYKALTGFATLRINITKLESYLVGDRFNTAQFYIDVVAHRQSADFAIALKDLSYFCEPEGVRVMGSYLAHAYRKLS